MMALALPAQTAVTLMVIPVLSANLLQASQAPDMRRIFSRVWPIAIAMILGTCIGTTILSTVDERTLLLTLGLFIIAIAALQAGNQNLQFNRQQAVPIGIVVGLLSGIFGGISSMFGPLLIIYLVALNELNKDEFISAISFLYLCALVPWTVLLIWLGLLDSPMLVASTAATLPVMAGVAVGTRVRQKVSERTFRQLILTVLLASGLSMMWQALQEATA